MACGFHCSKNALIALNVLYILVSLIMIGVAATAKVMNFTESIAVVGGIVACGVFLLLISILGIIGACLHHQVILFFYMVILFILFVIQLAISIACLSMNESARQKFLIATWNKAGSGIQTDVQCGLNCCGFNWTTGNATSPTCVKTCPGKINVKCCEGVDKNSDCLARCDNCYEVIDENMENILRLAGGIGLFFSFTEVVGVWLAFRFRNQKDPRANPSAFL